MAIDQHTPDALHVGFSKCASTFLQAYFEDHPEIFLINQSHYFSPFELSRFPEGMDDYRRLYTNAETGQVRLESDEHILMPLFHPVLDAAATTLESTEEVAARIAEVNPTAKIAFVIRNHLDLLVSRYSEFVICGGSLDFTAFVDEFLCCSRDGINYFQNYYAQIFDIFTQKFSAGRVLLLLQEDLARDEAATVRRLSSFLEVSERSPQRRGMISRRVGLSMLGIGTMRRFNDLVVVRPKRSFHEAEVRMPFLAYKVLQRGLRIADYYAPKRIKGNKRSLVTDEIRERLFAEFREDNGRLSALLGRNLSELGYVT